MSVRQMILRLGMVLLAAAVLAGCSSPTATVAPTAGPTTAATTAPTSPAPTAAATVDLQPTFNAIKTQSAATVIANLTQNAPTAAPVIPATATPAAQPTATAAPSSTPLPRATTAPTAAATATAVLKPWTLVPTQAAYSCMVIDYSPKASVSFSPSADFDVQWVIKNTGKLKWLATETQFHYADGVKMQKKGDTVDLKTDVAPNGSYTVGLDMLAPAEAGTYWITWKLTYGNVSICSMSLSVVVK